MKNNPIEKMFESKKKFQVNKKEYTYFIGNIKNNFVKIGKSDNPENRLTILQIGCPFKLELIYSTDKYSEKELHEKFKEEKINGEWFYYLWKIHNFIEKERKKDISLDISIYPVEKKQLNDFEEHSIENIKKEVKNMEIDIKENYNVDQICIDFEEKCIDIYDLNFNSISIRDKGDKSKTIQNPYKIPYRISFNDKSISFINFSIKNIQNKYIGPINEVPFVDDEK